MRILSMKPGHDGAVASVVDGVLEFSVEAEKDSFPRHESPTPSLVADMLELSSEPPDVLCISGWVKGSYSDEPALESGYFGWGLDSISTRPTTVFGRPTQLFSSTHERSHLLAAYGLSPFPQGQPCYALVWEGNIGNFYRIDENVRIELVDEVMSDPGNKYSHLFSIADPAVESSRSSLVFENAGRLMALSAFGRPGAESRDEADIIDFLLSRESVRADAPKDKFAWSPFYNIGVRSKAFADLAAKFSDRLFRTFYDAIAPVVDDVRPLIVAGGCGLNCEWNSRWLESGLFADVFVPPVTNDSGSAIGTAVDAQLHFVGDAKVSWDVYRGRRFEIDEEVDAHFTSRPLVLGDVARILVDGGIVAWTQGRYEIGPRALGNRSILASPFHSATRARLNEIKGREDYRPVAPVCMHEDSDRYFDGRSDSPHMLFFQRVREDNLQAVTHVDGSARVQTVRRDQNQPLYDLLAEFKRLTGYGVLANTSLNFRGRGFINRLSDLGRFVRERGLDAFVVEDRLYRPTPRP